MYFYFKKETEGMKYDTIDRNGQDLYIEKYIYIL